MTGAVRAGATVVGIILLAIAWTLYQGPVMGLMLSATAFCQ